MARDVLLYTYLHEDEQKDVVEGLRNLKNRRLLGVNEDFKGKHNAEIHFLVIYIFHLDRSFTPAAIFTIVITAFSIT